MKKTTAKHFLALFIPAVLLLSFSPLRPSKPTLHLQSVQIKPGTEVVVIGNSQGVVAVEAFVEYHNPSLISRFEQHGVWIDPQHGVYVEDEQGTRYGFSSTAPDRKIRRLNRIRVESIDENALNLRFLFRINEIPKSAGKLTLKTILNLDDEDASKAPARLPLAIVVRQ